MHNFADRISNPTWNSLIADIFWGVRDNMRDRELGRGDSLHQIFILS